MTPKNFVGLVRQCARTRNWEPLQPAKRQICQTFSDAKDPDALEAFAEDAARSCLNQPQTERLIIRDIGAYESQFRAAVSTALTNPTSEKYAALYFEYLYDGADDCEGVVLPCEKYKAENDSWIHTATKDFVRGPQISRYFKFHMDMELKAAPRAIADFYVHCKFLGASMRVWFELQPRIPLGFARHDGPVTHVPAATQPD